MIVRSYRCTDTTHACYNKDMTTEEEYRDMMEIRVTVYIIWCTDDNATIRKHRYTLQSLYHMINGILLSTSWTLALSVTRELATPWHRAIAGPSNWPVARKWLMIERWSMELPWPSVKLTIVQWAWTVSTVGRVDRPLYWTTRALVYDMPSSEIVGSHPGCCERFSSMCRYRDAKIRIINYDTSRYHVRAEKKYIVYIYIMLVCVYRRWRWL